ncbi:MAG: GntR family transcriptional regulator [Thermoleophilaceae bacterium]
MPPRHELEAHGLPLQLPDGRPKGQALREILEAMVSSLGSGAALPSERRLAERYGLARMTVRTEVDRLVAEGIVYRLHGRGSFVAEPRVAQAGLFSSFSEDMRARGVTPGSLVVSQRVIEAGPFLAGSLEIAPGAPVAEIERVRTADGTPLALERVQLPAKRFPGIDRADLEHGSLFELLDRRYGVSLAEADQRVVAVAVDGAEAAALEVPEGTPGLRFHTLARDGEGTPAYHATSLFRGDRYEIELRQLRA